VSKGWKSRNQIHSKQRGLQCRILHTNMLNTTNGESIVRESVGKNKSGVRTNIRFAPWSISRVTGAGSNIERFSKRT